MLPSPDIEVPKNDNMNGLDEVKSENSSEVPEKKIEAE
jgi:hypothetical protein